MRVTLPEILRLLPELRILLRSLQAFRSTGSVVINWLDHGPDILLRMDAAFTGPDRTKIIAFARDATCAAHEHRHRRARPGTCGDSCASGDFLHLRSSRTPTGRVFASQRRGRGGDHRGGDCRAAETYPQIPHC